MRVDAPLALASLAAAGAEARRLEALGYDGAFTFDGPHDPFFPLVQAAAATERLELFTGVAIAFARSPMLLAQIGHDLQVLSKGRFRLGLGSQVRAHIERRFSQPWSQPAARMREFVQALRAIWSCWNDGAPLDVPRRVLHAHADAAAAATGAVSVRRAAGVARRCRAAHDRSRGRSGGRLPRASVPHAGVPRDGDGAPRSNAASRAPAARGAISGRARRC